jgi:hypothetical protein
MQWMTAGLVAAAAWFVTGCAGSATSFGFVDGDGSTSVSFGEGDAGNSTSGGSSGGPSAGGGGGSSSSSGGPKGASSSGGGGSSSSSGSSSSGGSSSGSGGSSGGSSSGSGSSGGKDGGTDAAATVRYSTTIGPILDSNCTNACHGGCGGLNISYANIVRVKSGEVTGLDYVTPNDPGHSYLFCKVSPTDATCTSAGTTITGSKMPPGGSLSAANLAQIKAWIQGGAPN